MQLPALAVQPPNIRSVIQQIAHEKSRGLRNRLLQAQGVRAQQRLELDTRQYREQGARAERRLGMDISKYEQEAASKKKGEERERKQEQLLEYAQMAYYIRQGGDENERQERWDEVVSSDPQVAAFLGPVFDPAKLDMADASIKDAAALLRVEEPLSTAGKFEDDRRKGLVTYGQLEAQKAAGDDPSYIWALNTKTNQPVRATDAEIRNSSGRLTKVPTGMKMTVDKDGNVTFATGDMAAAMGTKTTGTIEGKLFDATEGIARLESIRGRFRPEYQQIATRWNAFKTRWREKLDLNVSADDLALLEDFSAYRRDSIGNINRYIKEITGAQMSEAEAKRLRKAVPDPGDGIFDGDSPTEFLSKMNATFKSLRLATARYTYTLRNGLDWKKLSLDKVENIMRKRMDEIEQAILQQNPDTPPEEVRETMKRTLAEEFGLPFGS